VTILSSLHGRLPPHKSPVTKEGTKKALLLSERMLSEKERMLSLSKASCNFENFMPLKRQRSVNAPH
jgi:hypothetical protein